MTQLGFESQKWVVDAQTIPPSHLVSEVNYVYCFKRYKRQKKKTPESVLTNKIYFDYTPNGQVLSRDTINQLGQSHDLIGVTLILMVAG